jgi:hypothetical protein
MLPLPKIKISLKNPEDIKKSLIKLTKAYEKGEIPEERVRVLSFLLYSMVAAIEVTDFSKRLDAIEKWMKEVKKEE